MVGCSYEESIKTADYWINKGKDLCLIGQYDEGLKCFDEAIKIDPSSENAWYNKGNALVRKRDYDESLRCYDEAIEANSTFESA